MKEIKRTGARSAKDISKDIQDQLNKGSIETANLVEWLNVDQKLLLKNVLTQLDRVLYLKPILKEADKLEKQTVNTLNELIGEQLLKYATQENDNEILNKMAVHSSDLVRCWAAYGIGYNKNSTIDKLFDQIYPFAADKHFGVREISWMAVRKRIITDLRKSVLILSEWAKEKDENIRRFASEATRPRGVWAAHIEELKQDPGIALGILEPLKSDTSRYVQNSVGNWLNDASKSQPEFVKKLCREWKSKSNTAETTYIIKKALRSI